MRAIKAVLKWLLLSTGAGVVIVIVVGLMMDDKSKSAVTVAQPTVQAVAADPEAVLANAQRPDAQLRFCEIIDDAAVAYAPQNAAWYAEKNPIAQDRLTPQLAAKRNERDRAVLDLVGAGGPRLDHWIAHVIDMSTSPGNAKRFTLTLTARCHATVTLVSEFDLTPQQADILATIQRGVYLRVSGTFISHDVAANTAARALDWDGFEGTAMESPTYRFTLTDLSTK